MAAKYPSLHPQVCFLLGSELKWLNEGTHKCQRGEGGCRQGQCMVEEASELRKAGGCYLLTLCLHLCGKAGVCESVLD